jgi:integrase/recombinase XerD
MDSVQAEKLFVQKMQSKNWSKKTIKNYACQVRLFLNEFKTRDRARNITADEIEKWLLTKVNINSRKHCRCGVNAFYKLVVGQSEKLAYIPWPKKEERLVEYITVDEAQKLISVCKNIKHKSIMCLMYGSGLRVGEVINLKPCDIKSDIGIINIIQGKGRKDRIVQLDKGLLELLRNYWDEYKPKGGYLFQGQFEPQYSERSINLFLKKYAYDAGIKRNIHAHLLRHGFATASLEMGTDIRYIQKLLGHNSIKTTLRYTHVSANMVAKIPSPLNAIAI